MPGYGMPTVCQELAKCGGYKMNEPGFCFPELIFFWGDPSICVPALTKRWHLSVERKLCALDEARCQKEFGFGRQHLELGIKWAYLEGQEKQAEFQRILDNQ